mmetsp:Transcript_21223/g.52226  ORF Transcript_21223/g.52226 Transcript_21223/m.52226 type:complete len:169 (+) Transcript_21223:127-633(+)
MHPQDSLDQQSMTRPLPQRQRSTGHNGTQSSCVSCLMLIRPLLHSSQHFHCHSKHVYPHHPMKGVDLVLELDELNVVLSDIVGIVGRSKAPKSIDQELRGVAMRQKHQGANDLEDGWTIRLVQRGPQEVVALALNDPSLEGWRQGLQKGESDEVTGLASPSDRVPLPA